ncbi:hypothetical protein [Burkholderia sp. Ac-20365]|uniref:outer membrane lipoprotein n=1 Tax=Burkholderia sp. Ac-20365 TaxID=2703897 RepID=UPI00197BD566|nr:hypothetical protein [Burkholderia sp. Ac-20365]MBN3760880.1 hypothetical protein [Burkholderia sp. Ac-20365]
MRAAIVALIAVLVSSLTGCANMAGLGMIDAPSFDRSQAYMSQNVQHGVVLQVREVAITAQSGSTLQGVLAGAPVGLLVSQVFHKSSIATQIGVGAMVTTGITAVSNLGSSSRGVQAIVRLDNGTMISVAQPMEQGNPILPGTKVLVLGSGRIVRSAI